MKALTRDDLMSLEQYARERSAFRQQVMEHKKNRRIPLGDHVQVYFEDRLTIQYQVQEMLRAERIFEPDAIQDELDTYNPLIPDGSNLKATFMVEYEDADERRRRLAELVGIEDKLWLQVEGCDRVHPIADEDLERDTPDKTSTVHFVRFELDDAMKKALAGGAAIRLGIEHPHYTVEGVTLTPEQRDALAADLDL